MHRSRRDFLKAGLAFSVLGGAGRRALAQTEKRSATDWVMLGNSGVKVTRLAFGTGTHAGRVQRELGQEGFTRLVRHAYESGIRFFETAESYPGMPQMLATALKGVPRDSYRLMTKYTTARPSYEAKATIDQFRKEMDTEYFDILLLRCVRGPTWATDFERAADDFSEAKAKKIILSHGASVHGLPALRAFPGNEWLDIAMVRMNRKGHKMDSEDSHDQVPERGRSGGDHAQGTCSRRWRYQHETRRRRHLHESGRPPGGAAIRDESGMRGRGYHRVQEHRRDR